MKVYIRKSLFEKSTSESQINSEVGWWTGNTPSKDNLMQGSPGGRQGVGPHPSHQNISRKYKKNGPVVDWLPKHNTMQSPGKGQLCSKPTRMCEYKGDRHMPVFGYR